MAHSQVHSRSSARRFGGQPEDYQEIHDLFDSTKAAYPDQRHRAILHHAFGIFLVERIIGAEQDARDLSGIIEKLLDLLGPDQLYGEDLLAIRHRLKAVGQIRTFTRKSDGVKVPIRLVGEQHVVEDQGYIPTMEDWLKNLTREDWMYKAAVPLSRILENFEAAVASEVTPAPEQPNG